MTNYVCMYVYRVIFQLLAFWQQWFKQLTHVSCFVSLSNICSLVYNLTVNRLRNQKRLQIIEFYYQNACFVKKVCRTLLPFYSQFNRPAEAAIRAIVTKFGIKFTLLDMKPPTRLSRLRTEENITAVSASINDYHQLSVRCCSQQLCLCYLTAWKILRKDLGVKPFKIQLLQELKPNDLPQCRIFD